MLKGGGVGGQLAEYELFHSSAVSHMNTHPMFRRACGCKHCDRCEGMLILCVPQIFGVEDDTDSEHSLFTLTQICLTLSHL